MMTKNIADFIVLIVLFYVEDGYECTGGRNLSEGDGKAGFSIDDWYHYTAALVLTYNIIHIQQVLKQQIYS